MTFIHLPQHVVRPGAVQEVGPDDDIPQYDLREVPWPADPYGYDHATNTARLALVVLAREFPDADTKENRAVLWTAALFHDVARGAENDPEHALRSSEWLARFLSGTSYHYVSLRDAACELVGRHHQPPTDPLSVALHDADALEGCRVRPGTPEGHRYMKERLARLVTPWAKDKGNLKRYMAFRGWK